MYSKVNLGLFLEDLAYFRIIRELIRIRDRSRVSGFKKSVQNAIYCDKCKGFGHTDTSGNPLSFSNTTLENVAIPISDEVIKDVAYLGKTGISQSQKMITTYRKHLEAIRRGLQNKTPNKSSLGKVFKASVKKCDECYGYGIKDVFYYPSFSIALYDTATKIAINYISKSKSKEFNLYNVNISISELYQQFSASSTLGLISKKENKAIAAKETQGLQSLRSSFVGKNKKYLVKARVKEGVLTRYVSAAMALRARALDEMFARWILQKLRATIRVDTGLSKRRLKADIQNVGTNSFRIFITSAKVMDKSPDTLDDTIYIKTYSDWLYNNRKEWSNVKGVPSLKKYLHSKITSEFIKLYGLDTLIETRSVEGGDLGKRLMKLIFMFGEKYGGK